MRSLPPPLDALVRPDRAFEGWTPSLRLAVAAIVVLSIVNLAGVQLAAGIVQDTVQGTVVVDNPEHVEGVVCDPIVTEGPLADTPTGCTAPEQVEREVGALAADAAGRLLVPAALGPLLGWLALTAIAVAWMGSGADVGDRDLAAIVGWSFVPAVLRYAARPIAVGAAVDGWTYPAGSRQAIQAAAAGLLAVPPADWYAAAIGLTVAWQLAILAFGLARYAGFPTASVAVVYGVPGVLFAAARAGVVPTPVPSADLQLLALFLLAVGAAYAFRARTVIELETTLDLVGMRGREHVSPTDWYVGLHRVGGAVVLCLAFLSAGGHQMA